MVMKKGQVSKIKTSSEHVCVSLAKGTVWITTPREARDLIMTSGEDCRVKANGDIVIEALDESEINVC